MSEQTPPEQPTGSAPSQTPVYSPRRQGPRRKFNPLVMVFGLSVVFFAVFAWMNRRGTQIDVSVTSSKKDSPAAIFSKDKGAVGILELNGVIMDSKKLLEKFDRLERSKSVKAIVLRVNSPGGAVAPSQEIYEAVKAAKKPVVASMSSVAASGGYYVAVGAQKIFANPGTLTGSIGVIMEFANLEKLYEWAKIKRYSIKTGRFKDAGAEYKDMSPEDRELFQTLVNDVLSQFKSTVAERRKLTTAEIDSVADGRVVSGTQALKYKLVDQLGTLDDAIKEAAKMAKIDGEPRVVYPAKSHKGLIDFILEQREDDDDDGDRASSVAGLGGWIQLLSQVFNRTQTSAIHASPQTGTPGVYWLWKGGF